MKCIQAGCGKPSIARGLCESHYRWARRLGKLKQYELLGPQTKGKTLVVKQYPRLSFPNTKGLAGRVFKTLRKESLIKIPVRKLSGESGLTSATIYRFERGDNGMTIDVLTRLIMCTPFASAFWYHYADALDELMADWEDKEKDQA